MITSCNLTRAGIFPTLALLAACGPGGGGSGSTSFAVTEVDSDSYPALSDRAAVGAPTEITVVVLENRIPTAPTDVSYDQASGLISGGDLAGADIDDASFTNPANGEISRVVTISGTDNYFGVVGFGTQQADLPTGGTTSYNEGWTALTATTDQATYTLEGTVNLTANWDNNRLSGTFGSLSGTRSGTGGGVAEDVSNVGTINLSNTVMTNGTFAGGSVTGSGIFDTLNNTSDTSGTQGAFFGAQADELGGLLVIDDGTVDVIGAFQAD
ncbi:MAG: transferrin-binding protein-like solute binding protein [Pseudomonadota bacterium]